MEQWRQFLVRTVRRSIKNHEMRPDADPEQVGTVFIATIEGAVMMSKLYGDMPLQDSREFVVVRQPLNLTQTDFSEYPPIQRFYEFSLRAIFPTSGHVSIALPNWSV
jgi:hypothetical protein